MGARRVGLAPAGREAAFPVGGQTLALPRSPVGGEWNWVGRVGWREVGGERDSGPLRAAVRAELRGELGGVLGSHNTEEARRGERGDEARRDYSGGEASEAREVGTKRQNRLYR